MKKFLHKYSATILKILAPLGPFGVFAIAAVDSTALGLPVDAIVAGFVFNRPAWFWIYALMAASGSALGSLVIYGIGYKGEEVLLEKRVSKERIEALRRRFETQEFLALMVPAVLPPPTPFKLFVLAAGAFRMRVRQFLLAIFTGRMIRFLGLAALIRFFGPEIVHALAAFFRAHFWLGLAIALAVVAVALLLWRRPWRRRKM